MTRLLLALLLFLTTAPAAWALGVEVVAPRDGGLVLGDVAIVEVSGSTRPPRCALDGAPVSVSWTAGPRRHRWIAEVPLGRRGAHELEVSGRAPGLLRWVGSLRRDRVRFRNDLPGSVAAGDLAARHFLSRKPTTELAWQWGPAVFLYGLHRLSTVSPERARYVDALRDYFQHHEARGRPRIDYPDRCPPALTALALARTDGVTDGLAGAREVADYLRHERLNALGAIDHLGSRSRVLRLATAAAFVLRFVPLPWRANRLIARWPDSIWVDSLVMYALFAAQWGEATGDVALRELGLSQPGIFARALQDPRTGLFHHAWDLPGARPMGAVWLRGNGWVAVSCVELLDATPPNHPRRPELLAIYRDLAQGLLVRQGPHGLWPTVLDDPTSYAEASGSALVAYAIARGVRRGYLPPADLDTARRTFRALTSRLAPRTHGFAVTDTSVATSVFPEPAYRLIPRRADVDYGVGAYLLLAAELAGERW